MIRAVVVDDEKLVRKGFISMIDWARFGIVMVGEAPDGRSALELLERVEVDLLFTDITMPGLSGFELIKQVRTRFPRICSVVLTCHHEFDFIQEALRLGAIDYIVKTLLEMDNADEVIARIVERFQWEEGSRATLIAGGDRKRMPASSALLFRPVAAGQDSSELFRLGVVRRNQLIELDGTWIAPLIHPPAQEELRRDLTADVARRWQIVLANGLLKLPLEDLQRTLSARLDHWLFYAESADVPIPLEYEELTRTPPAAAESGPDPLDDGLALKWAVYNAEWDLFVRKVGEQRPEPQRIARFAESLCRDWNKLLLNQGEAERLLAESGRIRNWGEGKLWLRRFSDQMHRRMNELSLSKEVMLCLVKAFRYMKQNAGGKLNQNDVTAHIHMSRSYFSQCFARMAGESFGETLRNMRIDRAKALLLESSVPIYEIAALAGFEDDKYFSKMFREHVGKLPSEFRADGGESV